MKKIDWEGACPPAPEGFTQAMNRALEKTRAVEKKRPAPLRRLALACSAALFLLLTAAAATGLLQSGYEIMRYGETENVAAGKALVALGDTLYATDGEKLVSYVPGEGDYTVLIQRVINQTTKYAPAQRELRKSPYYLDALFCWQGRLCGLNAKTGLVFAIAWEEGQGKYTDLVKLQMKNHLDGEGTPYRLSALVVQGDTLYLVRDLQTAGSDRYRLDRFDLRTGAFTASKARSVREICPYREGALLALVEDPAENAAALCRYDPAADTLTPLFSLEDPEEHGVSYAGLEYNAEADCAYLLSYATGRLFKIEGMKKQTAFSSVTLYYYYPVSGRMSALVENRFYCFQDMKSLYIRNPEAPQPQALRLLSFSGGLDAAAFRSASSASGLAVSLQSAETRSLSELLLTRDDSWDIYLIDTDQTDLARLREKGYLLPAPESSGLSGYLGRLYPLTAQAAGDGAGRMLAVPLGLRLTGAAYAPDVAARMGLTEAELPRTLDALLTLLEKWQAGEISSSSAYDRPVDFGVNARPRLIALALSLYDAECARQGKAPDFQDAALSALLRRIDALDEAALGESLDYVWNEEEDESYQFLLQFDAGLLQEETPLSLGLTEENTPAACQITLAVVNPFGARQADAWRLLAAYLERLPEEEKYLLFPDCDQPVLNPHYAQIEADLAALIAESEQAGRKTAAADYRAQLAEVERDYKYSVSSAQIARYQALMQNAWLEAPARLEGAEFSQLVARYAQRQISLDTFLAQAAQTARLMQGE